MTMKRALQIIFGIGLFGVAFSGTLSYRELSGLSAQQCPAPGPAGTILGYPACVYGLAMYLVITSIAAWALYSQRRAGQPTSDGAMDSVRRNLARDELA